MIVSILSERRAFQPYGLLGGDDAERGLNLLTLKEDGRTINLGGKNTVPVNDGDRLKICTPGGGGFGRFEGEEQANSTESEKIPIVNLKTSGSLHQYTMNQESV